MNLILILIFVFLWTALILHLSEVHRWTKGATWAVLLGGALLIGAFL